MPATSHRRATSEVVLAILAACKALTWTAAPGNPNPLPPLFDDVELFDSEDLVSAFQFLLITQQRVCIIVPLAEQFDAVFEGLKYMFRRRLPVIVLCSDALLGDRKASLWGTLVGAAPSPGAFGLAEYVLPAVSGLLLANPNGVVCEPKSMTVLTVKDTNNALPSRVTVGIEFECRGGRLETRLPGGSPGVVY